MKTALRFLLAASFALALTFTISCSDSSSSSEGDGSEKSVAITGIPAEYNGEEACFSTGPRTGEGYDGCEEIIGGKLEVPLLGDESEKPWTGTGNFPALLTGEFGFFIYTDGKTFEELQIRVCDFIYAFFEDELSSAFYNKLPKINFSSELTEVDFSKFEGISEEESMMCFFDI